MKNKKALIFCRASGDISIKFTESLSSQEAECRKVAEKDGYEVVQVVHTNGGSGLEKNIKIKAELWPTLISNGIQAVYSTSMERLSRDVDEVDAITTFCYENGIALVPIHSLTSMPSKSLDFYRINR